MGVVCTGWIVGRGRESEKIFPKIPKIIPKNIFLQKIFPKKNIFADKSHRNCFPKNRRNKGGVEAPMLPAGSRAYVEIER